MDNRDAIRRDERLQADPELHEGRSGMGRILMTLAGAAVVIGLVIFGIAQHQAENQSASSGASSPSVPPATAQNEAPSTSNPADKPPSTARGPSNAEQARQNNAAPGNTGQAGGNTGQTPAANNASDPSSPRTTQ